MNFADSPWGLSADRVWKAAHQEFKDSVEAPAHKNFDTMKAAVVGLVVASEEMRFHHHALAIKEASSKELYLREYHVVGVSGTRQSGKTELIVQLALPEDLIIAYNSNIANTIEERVTKKNGQHAPVVVTAIDLIKHKITSYLSGQGYPQLQDKTFPRIWVDEANMVFTNSNLSWTSFSKWVAQSHPNLLPTVIRVN